ncbi:MAG TPA: beta-1-3, beta-1-6-glucan biosynthesis protein [Pseudolabrys sp.]|jgi:hypothetical protein|nr:beta-1-3, beta-1-6-glucan biosynthesis protein [Pseudolabrys sp.]
MPLFFSRRIAATLGVALLIFAQTPLAIAQSGNGGKPQDQKKAADAAAAKEREKRAAEITEARRLINGPAGNPECVWLGRRVVGLLWRDDLDTAFRHLDLYDRFGCPANHIQATFRCVILQGDIDPKVPESLNSRVHACWLNPSLAPTQPAAAAPAQGTDAH